LSQSNTYIPIQKGQKQQTHTQKKIKKYCNDVYVGVLPFVIFNLQNNIKHKTKKQIKDTK